MDLDRVESVLEEYGLSSYQATAFLTILEFRDASVTEINEESDIPQPRIYDVLETLDEEGLIETYEKESLRARVTDPTDFIRDLERKADDFYASADVIEEYWQKPPLEKHEFEIYSQFRQLIDHSIEGIGGADESVHLATSASDLLRIQDALKEAIETGIIINVSIHIDEASETDIDDLKPYLREMASEVRYRETPGPFLALVDSHKAYFGVSRPRTGYGIFVQDQALSTMLYQYFQDSLWSRWEVIHGRSTGDFPKEYASIRTCIRELWPYVDRDVSLQASVNGYKTDTGREKRIEGEIVSVYPDEDSGVAMRHADQACLFVESGSETYTVGGFGAIVEDIRATRIRISGTDSPADPSGA